MQLDCGIARMRIVGWLSDELALASENGIWSFSHEGATCQVRADDFGCRELGKMSLERTLVTVEGDERAKEEFMRLFTLRFMSAGG